MKSNSRPGIGLAIIISKKDKLLLGIRRGSHDAGHFQFPGGHLEWGESFEDCALRETREETGLVIKVNPVPVAVTNDFFARESKHYITIFMRAEYISGKPRALEPEKCGGWHWYSKEKMPPKEQLFLPIQNLLAQSYKLFK